MYIYQATTNKLQEKKEEEEEKNCVVIINIIKLNTLAKPGVWAIHSFIPRFFISRVFVLCAETNNQESL